jgi:hypothetical protein
MEPHIQTARLPAGLKPGTRTLKVLVRDEDCRDYAEHEFFWR